MLSILNSIQNLIYNKKYNHNLWNNSFLTFLYMVALTYFVLTLFNIITTETNDQKNFNLFIGFFTIATVLLSSLITTLIQNNKRNKSIEKEYHDILEYLRNLHWYLHDGYNQCRILKENCEELNVESKENLARRSEQNSKSFQEMDKRIKNLMYSSSTFPPALKNQIYLALDQSKKIFGSALTMNSPYLEDFVVNVFIKSNYHILLDSFLLKYTDEEITKMMKYCFDSLIFSVHQLTIIRNNST